LAVGDGKSSPKFTNFSVAGRTFYETSSTASGVYFDASQAKTPGKEGDVSTNGKFGLVYSVANLALLKAAAKADVVKASWGFSTFYYASSAAKYARVENRAIFDNVGTTTFDHKDADDRGGKAVPMIKMNSDLILASFYQSNGTKTDGTNWCSDSKFYTEVKGGASDGTFSAQKGFGPKGKCTWQIAAAANTHAPAFSLTNVVKADLMIQVIEWYDVAQLGSFQIIDGAVATADKMYLGKEKASYATTEGVFFNPVEANADATMDDNLPKFTAQTWSSLSNEDSSKQIPNSVGMANYYEQDGGVSTKMV